VVWRAQTPLAREIAAVSSVQPTSSVWETAIAEGDSQAMAVFHVLVNFDPYESRIGYALAERQGDGTWQWTLEGIINENDPTFTTLGDPSVAWNPTDREFLICALRAGDCPVFFCNSIVLRCHSFRPTTGRFQACTRGIDVGADRVWTTFMGPNDDGNPATENSLIWSTQVLVP